MTQQSSLDKATTAYHMADTDYKEMVGRYSVLLLSAELAVIGFLLQNTFTRHLLRIRHLQILYLIAISTSLMVIALRVVLMKFERAFEKNNMYVHISSVLVEYPVEVWGKTMKLPSDTSETKKALENVARYDKRVKQLLPVIEYCFVAAALSGVVFAYALVLSI